MLSKIHALTFMACALSMLLVVAAAARLSAAPASQPQALTAEQKKALLQERDRYLAEVNKLGRQGKLAEAIAAAEKMLAVERRLFGDVHEEIAGSLALLGQLNEARENWDVARKVRSEALTLLTKLHGAKDWRVTDARLALALVETLSRLEANARKQLRVAEAQANQAGQLYRQGKYQQAIPVQQQVVKTHRAILGEHRAYAESLNLLAVLYGQMGDYAKALPLSEQSRDLFKQLLTENHPDYATSLNNLAMLYRAIGDYGKALPLVEQARELVKKLLTENHPNYASSLNNLAWVYEATGDYAKALLLYEQARDLRKRLLMENDADYAAVLDNLAAVYQAIGDYTKALPLCEQARDLRKKLLTESHPRYAHSLNNLALLHKAMGNYAKALPLYEQARDLRKKLLTENHPDYAQSLDNLAELYRALGEYSKALPLYERARDLRKQLLTENHPTYATSLNNLAILSRVMGDYGKALFLYEQARDLRKKLLMENHPDFAQTLNNLAVLYQAMGDYSKALPLREQNLSILQAHLDNTFTAMSSRQRLESLARVQQDLHRYLTVAAHTNASAADRYARVLAFKGAAAARQSEESLAYHSPELQPLLQHLRQVRAGLARVANTPPTRPELRDDWLQRFRTLEADKEKLEVQLAQGSAAFRRFQELRKANAVQVRAALPPRTTLIEFLVYTDSTPLEEPKGKWRSEERILAFALSANREVACLDLGDATFIDHAIDGWRKAIIQGKTDREAAALLAQRLWEPLRPHLGDASTVLIAPDGPLCGLPFAALPGAKPGSVLLQEVAIGYVTSGRHVLELHADTERQPSNGLLVLGGLDYGQRTAPLPESDAPALFLQRVTWKPLPAAAAEVTRLGAVFRQRFPAPAPLRVLDRDTAAAQLKQVLTPGLAEPRYRYLHLATHAFFEPPPKETKTRRPLDAPLTFGEERSQLTYGRNPMLQSGLVLARANAAPDEGTLTAEEVAVLDLRGVEVAVLSACDTGLGKVAGGEGVLGLQRAFQAAGARSLVVSLWSVNDVATSVLMEEFYTNLWQKKLDRLESLRQAQLMVLRHPERVEARAKELARALRQQGATVALLRTRGIDDEAVAAAVPVENGRRRSPPAWWAAWLLSGDPGR
jgi:CHAT domain-containing protein